MNQLGKKGAKEVLKQLLRELHKGASPEEMRSKFRDVLASVTPSEIAQVEGELVREGMPSDEIRRLCDLHLSLLRESIERERIQAPPGHPVRILMEEHSIILGFAEQLRKVATEISAELNSHKAEATLDVLRKLADHFKASESHYVREENVLFPYLERHGITEPPAIMWSEHTKIREIEKNLFTIVGAARTPLPEEFGSKLLANATALAEMLSKHFYKENNILFPTSLKVITEGEWRHVRKEFDGIGYCCFTPQLEQFQTEEEKAEMPGRGEGIDFETGTLSKEELEAMLNTLPVDITFVDKDDNVRYFSQSKDRIFVRTKAVIGRKVQQCHPKKSLHVVNRILEEFRSGKRDVADFWIDLKGRLIYIRYFAVRNKDGHYLGCLEVTQDVTEIKKLQGEKRLLS